MQASASLATRKVTGGCQRIHSNMRMILGTRTAAVMDTSIAILRVLQVQPNARLPARSNISAYARVSGAENIAQFCAQTGVAREA
jgi:hypothetical protein